MVLAFGYFLFTALLSDLGISRHKQEPTYLPYLYIRDLSSLGQKELAIDKCDPPSPLHPPKIIGSLHSQAAK